MSAVCWGISAAVSGRGVLRSQNATSPSAASSARAISVLRVAILRDQSSAWRNFSWQPWQDLPSAGNAALKEASSVEAFTAVIAFT